MVDSSETQYSSLPLDNYNPLTYGNYRDDRIGLVKELSPRAALVTAIAELRGNIQDPETGEVVKKVEPIMNEHGISIFFHAVTSSANDINTFSNYRADVRLIYKLMMKFITDIVYEFYYNRKSYDIKEESQCSLVVNKAVGLMLPAFFKALGAGDRRAATSSVQEMIQRAFKENSDSSVPGASGMQQPSRKKGILSKMNPFGG